MASITLKGNPCHTSGNLPAVGSKAPAFTLIGEDLSEQTLESFAGKSVVISIFPSIDTPVCATAAKHFNEKAAALGNTVVVNVSMDLPFAAKRFCAAEGIENVINLSSFRSNFGTDYGMEITDGPLKGLFGRGIVVINESGEIVYNELVTEIADEPNYDAALSAVAQTA